MVKLTPEVILRCSIGFNALSEREICMRGMKIPAIECISVLQDQVDVIDLSDNEVRKIDNFPEMKRLNTLLINNNNVSKVDTKIATQLPNLTSLILTNNRVAVLSEIDVIATLAKLEYLSLLGNPVTLKINYRLYTINRIPSLRSLDFKKISRVEREEAVAFFQTEAGKAMMSAISSGVDSSNNIKSVVLSDEQKRQVREAITRASTKEEVDLIERQLKEGTFAWSSCDVEMSS